MADRADLPGRQRQLIDRALDEVRGRGEKVVAIVMSEPALLLMREEFKRHRVVSDPKVLDDKYAGVPIELDDRMMFGWVLRLETGLWPHQR